MEARIVLIIGLLIGAFTGALVGGLISVGTCFEEGQRIGDVDRGCQTLAVALVGGGAAVGAAVGGAPGALTVRRRRSDPSVGGHFAGPTRRRRITVTVGLLGLAGLGLLNGGRLLPLVVVFAAGYAFMQRGPVLPPPPSPDARPVVRHDADSQRQA